MYIQPDLQLSIDTLFFKFWHSRRVLSDTVL